VPRNKTHLPARQGPVFNAQELLNASNEAIQAFVTHGACICSPKGILCAFKGNYAVKCSDMPWACPLASSRQTPTV
jgi:hypothetical protein